MTKINLWDDGRVELPPSPDHKGGTEENRAKRKVRWELLHCAYSWSELKGRILDHNALPFEERCAFLGRLHALAAYLGITTDKLKRQVPGGNSANNNNPKGAEKPTPVRGSKPSSSNYFGKK